MRNLKLTIAYRGCHYLGWQDTGTGPTIESELRRAAEQLLRHPIALQAASRTDAGVHARGQVVNLLTDNETPRQTIFKALNNLLPPDIRVVNVEEMSANFHPTLDARAKTYRYRLAAEPRPHWRHIAWHQSGLCQAAMNEAAQLLVGEHDFRAFCNQRKDLRYPSTHRTLYQVNIEEWEGGLEVSVTGNQFLYKMARNIAGTLAAVGAKELSLRDVQQLLQGGNRCDAGVTAPAHGLCLERIYYELKCLHS